MYNRIEPRSGASFVLEKGRRLLVRDPSGQQVSDMVVFAKADAREVLSNGKTFDFESTLRLSTGNFLWSNRSNKLAKIVSDSCGTHDFLLAPCSRETFEILYDDHPVSPSCFENLSKVLERFDIDPDSIPTAFNIFMNVGIEANGLISVQPPLSKAGDEFEIEACTDLIVGLTACSARDSNNQKFKPIDYLIG